MLALTDMHGPARQDASACANPVSPVRRIVYANPRARQMTGQLGRSIPAAGGSPRAVTQTADGALVLLADTGGTAKRFTWRAQRHTPERADVARFSGYGPWRVNASGDVLLLSRSAFRVRAVAIDATGARAELAVAPADGRGVSFMAADLGEDGTSAVAWSERLAGLAGEDHVVFVRIRPRGGDFGPVIQVPAAGEARDVDVRVHPDGLVEVLYAAWADGVHRFFDTQLRAGGSPSAPVLVTTTPDASPLFPVLGAGRMLFGGFDGTGTSALAQRSDGTWSQPQALRGYTFDASALTTLPDGTSVVAYHTGRGVFVARAPAGSSFGAGVRIGRATSGWEIGSAAVTSSPAGELLAVWGEYPRGYAPCLDETCFTRLHAAVAPPGGRFGPSSLITGLGTVAGATVQVIGGRGRRLVAWEDGWRDTGHNPLVATFGATRGKTVRTSREPLRATVTVSRRALRAATRSSRLPVHVTCNRACAVRVMIFSASNDLDDNVYSLPAVVLLRAGTMISHWRLLPDERAALRRSIRAGRLRLPTNAEDRPGHIRNGRARLRR
jgi:hypothetical protein